MRISLISHHDRCKPDAHAFVSITAADICTMKVKKYVSEWSPLDESKSGKLPPTAYQTQYLALSAFCDCRLLD